MGIASRPSLGILFDIVEGVRRISLPCGRQAFHTCIRNLGRNYFLSKTIGLRRRLLDIAHFSATIQPCMAVRKERFAFATFPGEQSWPPLPQPRPSPKPSSRP